ncbi:CG18538, partial [Drosophila busckii]
MQRRWDYEPLTFEGTSSDPSKLNIDMAVERVKREFAMTGVIDCKYDMDKTTMRCYKLPLQVEAVGYRSNTGDEADYKLLPWAVPKQTFPEFLGKYYEHMALANVGHCSNLPAVENMTPWPQNAYKFDKCIYTGDGLPDIAPEGFYKVIFTFTGEVDWTFTVISKITSRKD